MIVSSLRLQCGAAQAFAAPRCGFAFVLPSDAFEDAEEDGELDTLEGSTQLIRASILNNLPRVLQLIQLSAPLELVDDSYGRSALRWACDLGHELVAKALMDGKFESAGARVDVNMALSRASRANHAGIAHLMLTRGALVNELDSESSVCMTPLMHASYGGCEAVVRLLLGHGADVRLKDDCIENGGGCTALALAISQGHDAIADLLRAAGAKA